MRHLLFACSLCLVGLARSADAIDLYVGTGGDGIYRTEFDPESGELSDPVKVAQTERPTFIWIHASEDQPQRSHLLYSICELGRGKGADGAAIVSWSIDPDSQRLTQTSRQDAEHDGPCFVTVSADGRYAALANYGGGSVALFPILDDGSLAPASAHMQHTGSSVDLKRQREPHAHSIRFDPSDRRVAACDLGTDKVYLYDVGSGGSLTPSQPAAVDMPAGSGPRHLVFSPDEKYLLVLGELSGQITTLRYAPPKVSLLETISTMSADTPAEAPRGSAEILFHPGGRFVYCSNRGPSEIACFEYDSGSGRLKRTSAISSGGVHPRNFRISPDGRFLLVANQMTDNIVVFRIDPKTGRLTKTATELGVPKPMCLKFL